MPRTVYWSGSIQEVFFVIDKASATHGFLVRSWSPSDDLQTMCAKIDEADVLVTTGELSALVGIGYASALGVLIISVGPVPVHVRVASVANVSLDRIETDLPVTISRFLDLSSMPGNRQTLYALAAAMAERRFAK